MRFGARSAIAILAIASSLAGPSHAASTTDKMSMPSPPNDSGTDGAPGKAADADRTVRIEAHEMAFSPTIVQVTPGETIRLVVHNSDKLRHEFVIASHAEHLEHRAMMQRMPDMNMDSEPNALTIEAGQTKELVWKFGRDPEVEFSCDIPGHAEAGMSGHFRATAAPDQRHATSGR